MGLVAGLVEWIGVSSSITISPFSYPAGRDVNLPTGGWELATRLFALAVHPLTTNSFLNDLVTSQVDWVPLTN